MPVHNIKSDFKFSFSDDLILYTVTSDATLRVFLPVLDFPHRLQLHASLDLYSSLPFSMASNYSQSTRSSIFWLNKDIIKKTSNIIASSLERPKEARERRLREIVEEGWDLFLRILDDGSLVVSAIDVSKSSVLLFSSRHTFSEH